jgi:hypothetical protein
MEALSHVEAHWGTRQVRRRALVVCPAADMSCGARFVAPTGNFSYTPSPFLTQEIPLGRVTFQARSKG